MHAHPHHPTITSSTPRRQRQRQPLHLLKPRPKPRHPIPHPRPYPSLQTPHQRRTHPPPRPMHRIRRQRTRRPPPCRTPTTTTTSRHRRRTKCGAGDRQRSMDWGCWVVDRAQLVRGTLGGRVWPWTGSGLGCAWAGRGVELWPGPGRRGLLGCHGCGLGAFVCPLGGSVTKDARGRGWLAVSGGGRGSEREKTARSGATNLAL